MKSIKMLFPVLLVLFLVASCGSATKEKLHGKWVLKEVTGFSEEQNKIMGAGEVYVELKDDDTFTAYWYSTEDPTKFTEQKGTWLFNEMEVEGGIGDLILTFEEAGNDIMVLREVTENKLVLGDMNSEYDFIYEKQ